MKAKILLFDLETFPNVGYTWSKWETNVIKFTREWELASFAYKWLDEKKIHCYTRHVFKEKQLVEKLHKLLDEADIAIAHNGDQFDLKKIKAKFAQFNLNPPSLYKSVDTKKIAKSQFGFNSNSLNDLAQTLGLGAKVEHEGFALWEKCMSGNAQAWRRMMKYNKQDVALLEKLYLKFRAWAPNHPSVAALENRPGCPSCGSDKVQTRGFLVTTKNRQQRYHCQDCGKWYTGKTVKNV